MMIDDETKIYANFARYARGEEQKSFCVAKSSKLPSIFWYKFMYILRRNYFTRHNRV